MKTAARLVHHAKFEYNINKMMRQEIGFFRNKLLPISNNVWETPIAHIIPWMPVPYLSHVRYCPTTMLEAPITTLKKSVYC